MSRIKTMKKKIIGKMFFDGTIDITDPCYDRDIWCRMNDVKIIRGVYDCVVWMKDCGNYGNRVGTIGIYLGGVVPAQNRMEYIGTIGVDAGLAGFFENKPDYSDEEWSAFCDRTHADSSVHAWIFDEGFFSSSGFGDGEYDVYVSKSDFGDIWAVEIRFL